VLREVGLRAEDLGDGSAEFLGLGEVTQGRELQAERGADVGAASTEYAAGGVEDGGDAAIEAARGFAHGKLGGVAGFDERFGVMEAFGGFSEGNRGAAEGFVASFAAVAVEREVGGDGVFGEGALREVLVDRARGGLAGGDGVDE